MPKQIWTEGRVVGYSAYEIYIKQFLAENPDGDPATEREWLASSLAMGSSLLMKVPAVTAASEKDHTVVDILLPENSTISAANTILGTYFDGECSSLSDTRVRIGGVNDDIAVWATWADTYGQLISNEIVGTKEMFEDVPLLNQAPEEMSAEARRKLKNYLKVVDGVVIQPGDWSDSSYPEDLIDPNTPLKLTPDLSDEGGRPYIRLDIRGTIEEGDEPWILLTGFTIRSVLMGLVKTDWSNAAENGDFLGPEAFPWANKIVFSVPNSYVAYLASGIYNRELPADDEPIMVEDTSIIDMKSVPEDNTDGQEQDVLSAPVLESYYSTALSTDELFYDDPSDKGSSRVEDDVQNLLAVGDGAAVLTVYSRKAVYPPALYGTFAENPSPADNYLHPIDIVAPGTVKIFHGADEETLADYQDTFPGTTAMNETKDGELELLNPDDPTEMIQVAKVELSDIVPKPGPAAESSATHPVDAGPGNAQQLTITAGKRKVVAISLDIDPLGDGVTPPSGGNPDSTIGQYTYDGTPVNIPAKPSLGITLDAQNSNDFVTWSALLAALANERGVDILAERLRNVKNSLINPFKVGPYIEFGPNSNPIRLYISNTQPPVDDDVPVGSIGIGWGFSPENN